MLREHFEPIKNMETISADINKCNGCRSCELACSFHHLKCFDPSNSSIKVYRDDEKGTLELSILSTCDTCANEKVPLCILYCSSGCLTRGGAST